MYVTFCLQHLNIIPFPFVCQLVEVRGRPRMKISEDPQKSTIPGRKKVYRLLDAEGENYSCNIKDSSLSTQQ